MHRLKPYYTDKNFKFSRELEAPKKPTLGTIENGHTNFMLYQNDSGKVLSHRTFERKSKKILLIVEAMLAFC